MTIVIDISKQIPAVRQPQRKFLGASFATIVALREAKLSLKRFRNLVFGEKAKKREPLASGGAASEGGGMGKTETARVEPQAEAADNEPDEAERGVSGGPGQGVSVRRSIGQRSG